MLNTCLLLARCSDDACVYKGAVCWGKAGLACWFDAGAACVAKASFHCCMLTFHFALLLLLLLPPLSLCPAGKFYTLLTGSNERRWGRMKDQIKVVVSSFIVDDRF